jgi:very-short-patch-repair endonuclease
VGSVDGLLIEHPVRAWRQAGTLWAVDDLVGAADFLVARHRPLATIEELRHEVKVMGDVPGRALARALRDVREGAESPEETRLRLILTRAGLPDPELNWDLRDITGRLIARLDLAYPALRVGVEYDGRVHAEDARQFESDADRWSAIARAGWTHVRILRHHMRGRPPLAIDMVRRALNSAGWAADPRRVFDVPLVVAFNRSEQQQVGHRTENSPQPAERMPRPETRRVSRTARRPLRSGTAAPC